MTYEHLREKSAEAFKRFSGVKPRTFETMLEELRKAERDKKKPGRSPTLCLEDQLLLTLSYWREYRTQFHIAASYGIHESTVNRIITKVENVLGLRTCWLPLTASHSPKGKHRKPLNTSWSWWWWTAPRRR